MARRLAVAISQAPGFSGTPDFGQVSSAATSASCANSSANAHVAHHPREAGDELRLLDAEDRLDGLWRDACRRPSWPPVRSIPGRPFKLPRQARA